MLPSTRITFFKSTVTTGVSGLYPWIEHQQMGFVCTSLLLQ
jgi:hypothetical protein